MTNKHQQWYIRSAGEVSGPFNGSVIMNHLIVGRLTLRDEVSADQQHWLPLAEQPTLHPDTVDDDKAKRYLDERTGQDRRQQQRVLPPEAKQRRGERRAGEPAFEQDRRGLRWQLMQRFRERHERNMWPLLSTFVLLVLITIMAVLFPTTIPTPLPNCAAPAAPGVNWNNCLKSRADLNQADLSGAGLRNSQLGAASMMNTQLVNADLAYANLRYANLSYADLQGASLFGSNLSEADLSYADLRDADLAYADLSNARLGGSELSGARLDNAIWIDGRICAQGSTGECRLSEN